MMSSPADFDFAVAVVGASVAGCTAARLFAQRGARVALLVGADGRESAVARLAGIRGRVRGAGA